MVLTLRLVEGRDYLELITKEPDVYQRPGSLLITMFKMNGGTHYQALYGFILAKQCNVYNGNLKLFTKKKRYFQSKKVANLIHFSSQ